MNITESLHINEQLFRKLEQVFANLYFMIFTPGYLLCIPKYKFYFIQFMEMLYNLEYFKLFFTNDTLQHFLLVCVDV